MTIQGSPTRERTIRFRTRARAPKRSVMVSSSGDVVGRMVASTTADTPMRGTSTRNSVRVSNVNVKQPTTWEDDPWAHIDPTVHLPIY